MMVYYDNNKISSLSTTRDNTKIKGRLAPGSEENRNRSWTAFVYYNSHKIRGRTGFDRVSKTMCARQREAMVSVKTLKKN